MSTASVPSLARLLGERVSSAITRAIPEVDDTDPILRRSDRADWQANAILKIAKARGTNAKDLAGAVTKALAGNDLIARCEPSGPGFLNLWIDDAAITTQVSRRLESPRLGIGTIETPRTTVIDYSQPNIAKEMHVGHLRSTIIGDALTRILDHRGETVIRQNHLGDWGTQFGMLIQNLAEHPEDETGATDEPDVSGFNQLYRDARTRFEADGDFADRARERVVALQAGDPDTIASWHRIVAESKRYFEAIYDRLDVLLTDADAVGESFYNPMLDDVCRDLEDSGVAVRDDGALCVFFDDIKGPDGEPTPLIVQKKDGGYGYATTDLAAIRHRVGTLHADQILYVVDARQALHFKMVFATAHRAGWLPDHVNAQHLPFGTILGLDGKPFKTRAGDTVRLMDLLDSAVDRAHEVVAEKNPGIDDKELRARAADVGVGAVKYADLSTSRTRDYVFDVNRMVALNGDTGTYLQYAYARIQSILRKAGDVTAAAHPDLPLDPAERNLGLIVDELADTLDAVAESFEPHRLCSYLSKVAATFTTFYDQCPVLNARDPRQTENRLAYCRLTAETLRTGMNLLGIATPERL